MGIVQSFLDSLSLTPAKVVERSAEEQSRVEDELGTLSLYHFVTCPFCVRARRAMTRLGLEVELRDIHRSREHYDDLVEGGGSRQVPCLRIEGEDGAVEWLYESKDIVSYLESRFA